jgi:hypothetical protein
MGMASPHRRMGAGEDPAHPIGRLYFNPEDAVFHFDPGTLDYKRADTTLCGLATDHDNVIGSHGIPLSDDCLTHEWLADRKPCKGCFVNDWWKHSE